MIKKLVAYSLLLCLLCAPAFAYRGKGYRTQNGASDVQTITSSFNGNLSSADNDVQKALDTLDNMSAGGISDGDKGEVTVASSGASWTLDDGTTVSGWVMGASTATTPSADDNDTSLATSAYVQTEINAMGGRSLTMTTGLMDADAELYTNGGTLWIQDPTASDDLKTTWVAPTAVTITAISCESDQTVNFDLQVDDGTPTGVNGSDIACTTFATDSSLAGDVTLAAGDRLDLAVTSVSGTPTWVSISWKYTNDD